LNKNTKQFITQVDQAVKTKEIPDNSIVMYQYDHEEHYLVDYKNKVEIAKWIDSHDDDSVTHGRRCPIFVLNGVAEGLARTLRNSHLNMMNYTGSYVGQNGNGSDFRYNPVNTLEYLDKIDKQKVPASLIQMQSYMHKTFVPMLFKGIIQGGKSVKFWRGGTTAFGSKKDFRENYWAPAFKGKNGVFSKVDEMLPIIREPLPENWSAVIPQKLVDTVALGVRSHNGKHYIILANFKDEDQEVPISIGGIFATKVVDFFSKKAIGTIDKGVFKVTMGHFNSGYLVLELK
jgi:hypothetical protein